MLVRERDVPEGAPRARAGIRWSSPTRRRRAATYLIDGVIDQTAQEREIIRDGAGYASSADGQLFPASPLDEDTLRALRRPHLEAIVRLAWLFLGIVIVGFVLSYAQVYILHYTGQRIVYNIRQQIFAHLQRMPVQFFDRNPVGRLVTRATNDTDTLNEMFTNVLVNLFKDVFLLAGHFDRHVPRPLAAGHRQLAGHASSCRGDGRVPPAGPRRVPRGPGEACSHQRDAGGEHRRHAHHANFPPAEAALPSTSTASTQEHFQAMMREVRVFAMFRPAVEFFSSLALALIIWYGGGRVVQNTLDFGVLYLFIQYMQTFFQPINDLTEKYNIMQSAMASSERIFLILDTEEEQDEPDARPVPEVKGEIEFENVWFAYVDDEWVLKDVSFHVKPGETVALVGATGAGKTSIINLINRFYDIQKGVIRIDGRDIRKLKRTDLRRHIGIVLQDVFLFTGDVEANITLDNDDISPAKVREAARLVNAEPFIQRLPGGYKAPVMERGASFSAGQRQLLAFARALAYDPAILVLDEATANIDTETEQLIQESLKRLITGRTSIIIAHRLSTIQHADKIIVLHKGEIREMGTHQELLRQRGLYYRLYQLQYKDQLLANGQADEVDVAADGPRGDETDDVGADSVDGADGAEPTGRDRSPRRDRPPGRKDVTEAGA